ncbi:SPFH domain-containing protein [Streptomyces sp. NPDC059985]|uniref:SPFH domain-containing protein n=1 Tax=Streptomyces sp. NPDC059985 TaxID=3347025 RepID=UPI0036BCF244
MYPTRTTSTTGTLHVPPAATAAPGAGDRAPAGHTRPAEPPAAAMPAPATDRPREMSSQPVVRPSETGPGLGAEQPDRVTWSAPRAGSHAAAPSEEFPTLGFGARRSAGPADRVAEPAEQAGPHAFVAGGVFDPLARVRPEETPAGARTAASAAGWWPRPTVVAAEPVRSGTEYPARGAAPGPESRYREPAAFAEVAPSASVSGTRAPARDADRSSEFRSGHAGLAGPYEEAHRVRHAGSQIQVPVPVGGPGADPLDPVSEGWAPSPAGRAAESVPAAGLDERSTPGGGYAGPVDHPARPHPQDAVVVGVPAARPDSAEPEVAPAPRRGRWVEVPTAGRGLPLAPPDRDRAPAAPDPRGADTGSPVPRYDDAPTAPDRRGGDSAGAVSRREGASAASAPRGGGSFGSGATREGWPAAPEARDGGPFGSASRQDQAPTAPDPRCQGSSSSSSSGFASWRQGAPAASDPPGGGPFGSASQWEQAPTAPDPRGEDAFGSVSTSDGWPAAPEARDGDAFGSASRHDGVPAAGDPRGDVRPAPAGAQAGPADPAPALDIPHPAPETVPEAARSHPQGELWPAEAPTDSPKGSGIPGPDGDAGPAPAPAPDVAELVARAVARGMDATREDDDTQDLPHVRTPRGAAVTEIPVHLPFRAHPTPTVLATPAPTPTPAPEAATTPRRPGGSTRLPAGRRVPRGDDRLREHRGPVLPGWFALAVGALAMTGCAALLWRAGVVPAALAEAFGVTPRPYRGLRSTHWPPLAFLGIVTLLALGGLGRAKAGHAWVLTLFGRYRGTVRRTGLTWVSPLLLRRRVDVRLRHWRSEPMPAVDSGGLALQVVVQVVWQVKDTARATLAVEDHTEYLAEQVESAMARVLSQLPADAFHEDAPTLRDAEAVGDALTRMLAAETEAVGVEVFSAQPTRIEYAPEVAEAMRRRRVAAIDAKHRDTVLTSVVDAVDDTVHRLTSRGIVELDDYERKALVKDLTVAFYTGRAEQ